jgi:glyceraldehyde-3-phosphate dehydrogenase (NAD(P))
MTAVAVIGTGIIGKRVAAALAWSPGSAEGLDSGAPYLAGIALRGPNVFAAARPELPVFAADPPAAERLRDAGTPPQGDLSALLASADVVVDCGPARSGASRAPAYLASGVPAIFCGGERDARLGPLVHSALNPGAATPGGCLRLLSCNTTALARVLAGIGPADVAALDATVLRCSTDTDKAAKGITNGAVLSPAASHHGDDLREVAPGPAVRTVAATVPMTAGHFIHARVTLRGGVGPAEALDRLRVAERVSVLAEGLPVSTARLKHQSPAPWHDRHVLQVLPIDGAALPGTLEVWLSLDNQAITIPEALDAIQLAHGNCTAHQARMRSDRILRLHCETAAYLGSRPEPTGAKSGDGRP